MGDPRKSRRKYKGPGHPWQAWRIQEEKAIQKEYGLKNKKEIWKSRSELKRISTQVKKLISEKAKGNPQAVLEEQQLLARLSSLGLVTEGTALADVLALSLKDILNRRLQTLVFKAGLCLTAKQARQFIIHGHIFLDGRKMTVPSYLVKRGEESLIVYNPNSTLSSDEHPERVKKNQVKDAAKVKKNAQDAEPDADIGISEAELDKIEKEVGRVEV